jgi:hypothetical protein
MIILVHLLFFGVADDDNVVLVGQPKKTTIEVVKLLASDVIVL